MFLFCSYFGESQAGGIGGEWVQVKWEYCQPANRVLKNYFML